MFASNSSSELKDFVSAKWCCPAANSFDLERGHLSAEFSNFYSISLLFEHAQCRYKIIVVVCARFTLFHLKTADSSRRIFLKQKAVSSAHTYTL